MENKLGACYTYNEARVNKVRTHVRVRKCALRNGTRGDRESVGAKTERGGVGRQTLGVRRDRSSRDDLSRRTANDNSWTLADANRRESRPRTKWERQKGGEVERECMVASLGPTRV